MTTHPLLKAEVLRPPEFATKVGVQPPTVYAWIRSGQLKAHRVGGRFYIPATELNRLFAGELK
jgi:excisionase family DNA binding protein